MNMAWLNWAGDEVNITQGSPGTTEFTIGPLNNNPPGGH